MTKFCHFNKSPWIWVGRGLCQNLAEPEIDGEKMALFILPNEDQNSYYYHLWMEEIVYMFSQPSQILIYHAGFLQLPSVDYFSFWTRCLASLSCQVLWIMTYSSFPLRCKMQIEVLDEWFFQEEEAYAGVALPAFQDLALSSITAPTTLLARAQERLVRECTTCHQLQEGPPN